MTLIRKIRRNLAETFPPPARIRLKDDDGIIGVVTSGRFRNLGMIDRQNLIHEALHRNGLTQEEMRRVVLIVAVTPEEERAHSTAE
jgi:hypothetical protein